MTTTTLTMFSLREEIRRVADLEVELWARRLGSRLSSMPALTALRGALGEPRLTHAGSATIIRTLRLLDSLERRAALGMVVSRDWALRVRALAVLAAALDRQASYALSRRVDLVIDRIAVLLGEPRFSTALEVARSELREARRWVRGLGGRHDRSPGSGVEHPDVDLLPSVEATVSRTVDVEVDELPHPGACPLGSLLLQERQARVAIGFARVRSRLRQRRSSRPRQVGAPTQQP